MTSLFDPLTLGRIPLANRVVMAPLTRNRTPGTVPGPLNAEYYAQRASVGLIVSEGTQPSAVGQGYPDTPGLHSPAQVEGWRAVADAVHARGGRMVVQLMHAGRISHPDNTGGLRGVAPSPLAAPGQIATPSGQQDLPVPRELAAEELPGVVAEFVAAGRNAVAAGMDGVELHAANGYLLHQFLGDTSNLRTDGHGGSPANRARFTVEVAAAVAAAIGGDRVGIRISPGHGIQGIDERDPADVAATYGALVDGIAPLGLAYLHTLSDPRGGLTRQLAARFGGPVVVNDGFSAVTGRAQAQAYLDEGLGEAVAVGRAVLANPDLVERWRTDAALNEPDQSTFYGGGARGYTDYPALAG